MARIFMDLGYHLVLNACLAYMGLQRRVLGVLTSSSRKRGSRREKESKNCQSKFQNLKSTDTGSWTETEPLVNAQANKSYCLIFKFSIKLCSRHIFLSRSRELIWPKSLNTWQRCTKLRVEAIWPLRWISSNLFSSDWPNQNKKVTINRVKVSYNNAQIMPRSMRIDQ